MVGGELDHEGFGRGSVVQDKIYIGIVNVSTQVELWQFACLLCLFKVMVSGVALWLEEDAGLFI